MPKYKLGDYIVSRGKTVLIWSVRPYKYGIEYGVICSLSNTSWWVDEKELDSESHSDQEITVDHTLLDWMETK